MKALGLNQLKVQPFQSSGFRWVNLHLYIVEIPALRGAGLYRRSAMDEMRGQLRGPYRDLWVMNGHVADCADVDDPHFTGSPEK